MSVPSSRIARPPRPMIRVVPPSKNGKDVHVGRFVTRPSTSHDLVCRKGC